MTVYRTGAHKTSLFFPVVVVEASKKYFLVNKRGVNIEKLLELKKKIKIGLLTDLRETKVGLSRRWIELHS